MIVGTPPSSLASFISSLHSSSQSLGCGRTSSLVVDSEGPVPVVSTNASSLRLGVSPNKFQQKVLFSILALGAPHDGGVWMECGWTLSLSPPKWTPTMAPGVMDMP